MGTQLSTLILLLLLLLLFASTFAQRADFTPNSEEANRIFFLSNSASISSAINRVSPTVADHVHLILFQVDFVEKRILTSLAKGKQVSPNNQSPLCTVTDQSLNNSIFRYFGVRGIPDPDRACITTVRAEGDAHSANAPYSIDDFYNAINDREIILNENARRITSDFIDGAENFTGAETPHAFVYNTQSARCVLHSACGIRVGSDWRLATPIHNRPKYENLPDFGRQVINEYSRNVKGSLRDSILMRLPEFRLDDDRPRPPRTTTTYIRSGSGRAHPNCFRRDPIEENLAIVDALSKVDQDLTKAEDAIKPSTIAIFVFPLGFNLVPIALFAQVSRNSMLCYMLLTDVLTVLPLLVKGIELITIHQSPNRAFTMRITAALNGTRSRSAAAEIWAADCQSPERIKNAGIAFLVVALSFMFGGILAEFIAAKCATRHKQKAMQTAHEGKGHMLGVWAERDASERPRVTRNTTSAPPTELW